MTEQAPVEQRLRAAALALFEDEGYAATTVEAIAARAGVGRTTFFRTFASKEAAVFPDHAAVLDQVASRLAAAAPGQARRAVIEAAALVLAHYLEEGELARTRYRLTRSIPALRQREVAGQHRYQRVFGDFVSGPGAELVGGGGAGEVTDEVQLRAEVLAAAVVTVHNHVLRRWLSGSLEDPAPVLETTLGATLDTLAPGAATGATDGREVDDRAAAVLLVRTRADLDAALPRIRQALREGERSGP